MPTILNLDITPNFDCRGLRIKDISQYQNIKKVFNLILEIKAPGQDCFKSFEFAPNFDVTFNCALLNLCCVDCPEEFTELPDGNYEIKFSIAPNLETMVEYNHFRNCKQFKSYLNENCKLWKERCKLTQKDFNKKLDELYKLKELVNAAKYSAEECLDIDGALELYEEANSKLNTLSNGKSCPTC